MLEEYFILVRRIPGISLTPEQYWELDTWTTQKLLDLEYEIIKKEADPKGEKYSEEHKDNSPEMTALINELQEDG